MKKGRYSQANKEALISFMLYGVFFAWWYVAAYGLGSGVPSSYTYICIVGYVAISLLVWAVVKIFFKEIPLDEPSQKEGSGC